MLAEELEKICEESGRKIRYSYGALIFGTLALSIQFSPKFGNKLEWFLVGSWISLLLSGFICGWSIVYEDVFRRVNLRLLKIQEATELSPEAKKLGIDDSNKKLDVLGKKFPRSFVFQTLLFVAALVANMIFVIANYLN